MLHEDELIKAKEAVKRYPEAEADIEWYDDDTRHCIIVYVTKAMSSRHADIITAMIRAGFWMFDMEMNTEIDDTPVEFSAVYSFDC